MFGLATPSRIFLATAPVDMRKQKNGLWIAVTSGLGSDPHAVKPTPIPSRLLLPMRHTPIVR